MTNTLSVFIYSNGTLIHTVSADNIGEVENGYHQFELDLDTMDNTVVHYMDDGAISLAIDMLGKLWDAEG